MIETIRFNWFYTNEGEEYKEYTVGSDGVVSITEESYDIDRYFTVTFEDGHMEEVYNINLVVRVFN